MASYANEAELMRMCGHLYVPIALEGLATTLMCMAFGYLLLLITNKGRLQEPGKALWQAVWGNTTMFIRDIWGEVKQWHKMADATLDERFSLCRKFNQGVCTFQIVIGVLTVERWLHINNVNGFRYLGYSVTCPPMQAELVILLAPVVPCFKPIVVSTYIVTFAMLITGYIASVLQGEFYDGSMSAFLNTWELEDMKPGIKMWMMVISSGLLLYLSFLQIPLLALLYVCKGGVKAGLPHGYIKLLLIVSISWLAFPVWWCFSYEGMALISDTKMNAIVFAVLNVVSKGSYTLQMLSMTAWHRREKLRQDCIAKGLRPSLDGQTGLFETNTQVLSRKERRSETWVVKMLRQYDPASQAPQEWFLLDPQFRAYLVGQGSTPQSWSELSGSDRTALQDKYDLSSDLVGESKSEAKEAPASEAPSLTKGLRAGQLVTMARGRKGRLIKVLDDSVQVAVKGQQPETVAIEKLIVLKVVFMGVRGLRNLNLAPKAELRCTALVDTLPGSEAKSRTKAVGNDRARWDEQVSVHGFYSGDTVAFRLWCSDPATQSEDILGEVRVQGQDFLECGYEGELMLNTDGQDTSLYMSVMIAPVDMSDAMKDFGEPYAKDFPHVQI